jgi:hypothetical protein
MTEQKQFIGEPLPPTVADLIKRRKGRFEKTLNDMVEELYLKLWENEQFKKYLTAVTDGEAEEGSMGCDDHEAARMLRDLARKEHSPASDTPLASFKLSLKVIMRRYEMSRKLRRISLHGQPVPSDDDNSDI